MTRGRRLSLEWSDREGRSCLRIRGWTAAELLELGGLDTGKLGKRLAVLPTDLLDAGADMRSLQPIAGRFEIDPDAVCFIPRFPFMDGMSYSLLVEPSPEANNADSTEVWAIQRPATKGTPTTEVIAIYPTTDELPVNQLKLYIQFSSSMSEGWASRAVHVRRADNDEPLDGVFLAMEPELWDIERRRLTLLLDPGRIKRGLVPNQEAGYPLVEGVAVIVTIDNQFRDSTGCPLRAGEERRYKISPPVRARVDPADWRWECPAAGYTEPLAVEFDRPLDHALLQHCLQVNGPDGEARAGRGFVGPGERSWRFEPQSPWVEGRHLLIVDPLLEDLAGNSLMRVFDRDLARAEDAPTDGRHVAIDFTCVPPVPTEAR